MALPFNLVIVASCVALLNAMPLQMNLAIAFASLQCADGSRVRLPLGGGVFDHTQGGGLDHALLVDSGLREAKPKTRVKGFRKAFENKKEEEHQHFNLTCGKTFRSSAEDSLYLRCPANCGFVAQNKLDDEFCTFHCVANERECAAYNPRTIIADPALGICRAPMVQFCKEYNWDGTDTCKVCNRMFRLGSDGQCWSLFISVVGSFGIVLMLIVGAIVWWIADLWCRPCTNADVLDEAMKFRSLQKVRTGKNHNRELWPISTNLLREAPAGAAIMLFFNFQVAVISWAVLVAFGWMLLAAIVDPALWVIGSRRFGTPLQNCIIVAWGYEKQHELMWTKILFLVVVYTGTFFAALAHSVRQRRLFDFRDLHAKTMKDFAVLLEGVPAVSGSEDVEEDLRRAFSDACGEEVAGVSIAWDYGNHKELVNTVAELDMLKREAELKAARPPEAPQQEERGDDDDERPSCCARTNDAIGNNPVRRRFLKVEALIFSGEEERVHPGSDHVKEVLQSLVTSPYAFVVFETQKRRDAAVERLQATGFEYRGSRVKVNAALNEPDTVQWENFNTDTDNSEKMTRRLLVGLAEIMLALMFWTVVFYAPYAASVFAFNYDNGQEPGIVYSFSFSMVVVLGNQIMYEVCARVSDNMKFLFKDTREGCYMLLFSCACLYNVLVDVATTYFMAWEIMKELGFRNYHGVKLGELETFTERFESYPMQRSLGENVFLYAFPSTYVIPFVLEPLLTIALPLILGILIVRSHPEISSEKAKSLLQAAPEDLGRYGDLLLNCFLAILIFYFPGGYTHWIFLCLAASHVFIYCLDHYRMLRVVPNITICSMGTDWYCQCMLAPCTGLILSSLVFKANCQGYGYCLSGFPLIFACTFGFAAHCVLHLLLLVYLVPRFQRKPSEEDPCADITFKDVASLFPSNWFSTNPVHCLRSRYVHQHDPPAMLWVAGREHLMQRNEKINCHFFDGVAPSEEYEVEKSFTRATLKRGSSRLSLSPRTSEGSP